MRSSYLKRVISFILCMLMMIQMLPVSVFADEAAAASQVQTSPETPKKDEQTGSTKPATDPSKPPVDPTKPSTDPSKPAVDPTKPSSEPTATSTADETRPESQEQTQPSVQEETEPEATTEAPAEETEEVLEEAAVLAADGAASDEISMTVNGQATSGNGAYVRYGDTLRFEIHGASNPSFGYIDKATGDSQGDYVQYKPINTGVTCTLAPGDYYLSYEVFVDGATVHAPARTLKLHVQKGIPAAPQNLSWNAAGKTLSWDEVTKASNGSGLLSEVHTYMVSVKKDGVEIASASVNGTSYSFEASGKGSYSFSVEAVSPNPDYYENSEPSEKSYTIVQIDLAGATGITEVSPQSVTLLPGESCQIRASVDASYSFGGWSGAVTGITVDNAEKSTATVLVSGDYSGASQITLTALTIDGKAPTISSFDGAKGELKASASDAETGIVAYAFSLNADAPNAGEWKTAQPVPGTAQEFRYTLTDGGIYYFYAKDQGGNVAKAENAVPVTKITYADSDMEPDYLIASGTVTPTAPIRKAYTFAGWFTDKELTQKVETVSEHVSGGITLYAKWEAESLTLTTQGVNKTYDGIEAFAAVSADNTGNLSYVWKKNGAAVGTESSLKVMNAADSGVYTVTVTLKDDNGKTVDTKEAEVTVSISRAKLKVQACVDAESQSVVFGSAKPQYTVWYEGFAQGDDASVVRKGTLYCAYDPKSAENSKVGKYEIVLVDGTEFSADNYDVSFVSGELTVVAKSEKVTVDFASGAFDSDEHKAVYTGNPICPAIVVMDGSAVLSQGVDYEVVYSDNVQSGTASVTVTMKGNYSGEPVVLHFEIMKASFTPELVIPDGGVWVYDHVPRDFAVTGNPSDGTVSFIFAEVLADESGNSSVGEFTSVQPTDAGHYKVYAVIAESKNYEMKQTDLSEFTISPRTIKLTAASEHFSFDGSEHSNGTYTQEGDDFVKGQGFSSVTVAGSISSVAQSPVKNVISYELTPSTKERNYIIQAADGELTMGTLVLTVPYGAAWNMNIPGRASWTPVIKPELTVQYELQLYVSENGGEPKAVDGGKVTVEGTNFYDFGALIREDAVNRTNATYSFSIQTIPAGGKNQNEYIASEVSEPLGALHTAKVTVKSVDHALEVRLDEQGKTKVLIQGESLVAYVRTSSGFDVYFPYFEEEPADVLRNERTVYGYIGSDGSEEVQDEDGTKDLGDSQRYVKATYIFPKTAEESASVTLTPVIQDRFPKVESFTAAYTDDGKVRFTFKVSDEVGLAGWCITNSEVWDSDKLEWIPVSGKTLTDSMVVDCGGSWRLYVKDSTGNISHTYSDGKESVKSINVYEVTFNKGKPEATGEMQRILKIEGVPRTLPAVQYALEGYNFRDWRSQKTGIYQNEGKYTANQNDTLTAEWTTGSVSYTVEYYFQNINSDEYTLDESLTRTYSDDYNVEIKDTNPLFALTRIGFTFENQRGNTIVLDESGKTLKLYYSRNYYTITYSYTDPVRDVPVESSAPFHYGADTTGAFTEDTKPNNIVGWAFIGWNFGGAEVNPAVMPAHNIKVTGYFVPSDAKYHIYYYIQDLDDTGVVTTTTVKDTYSEYSHLDINSVHGTAIDFSSKDVMGIGGFRMKGMVASVGHKLGNGKIPEGVVPEQSVSVVVNKDASAEVYINVYYDRNRYTLTRHVWQGNVGEKELTDYGQSWLVYYGATLDEDYFSGKGDIDGDGVAEQDNWIVEGGYYLHELVAWSTGAADGDSRPEKMPAGDVSVTRQFVPTQIGEYRINVWFETEVPDKYQKSGHCFTFFGEVGSMPTVGDGKKGNFTIDWRSFGTSINTLNYYHEIVVTEEMLDNPITGTNGIVTTVGGVPITNTVAGEDPMELNVFFERNYVDINIQYFYNDGGFADGNRSDRNFANIIKQQKWGQGKYNIEPLAYFYAGSPSFVEPEKIKVQDDGTKCIYEILPSIAEQNFCNDPSFGYYVVSYKHVASTDATILNSVESVSEGARGGYTAGAGYGGDTWQVFYNRVDPLNQYYLDVVYNPINLTRAKDYLTDHGVSYIDNGNVDIPVTYTYNGKEYKVRVANNAFFYEGVTYKFGEKYEAYPGLGQYNLRYGNPAEEGEFIIPEGAAVKSGFTKTQDGKFFISGDYIYIPDYSNQFYDGHRAKYSFGSDKIGFTESVAGEENSFLNLYKAAYPDDLYVQGSGVSNITFGSQIVYVGAGGGSAILRITFHNAYTYAIVYNVGGTECNSHYAVQGSVVEKETIGCTHPIFQTRGGYHIVWYMDSGFTRPAETFTINGNTTIYGRYENDEVENHEYAFYELPDHTAGSGFTGTYITREYVTSHASEFKSVTNANGITEYYDAANEFIVMATRAVPCLTFRKTSMNVNDYGRTGFYYDTTQYLNSVETYCDRSPVTMQAYFARHYYNLTVDPNSPENKEADNIQVTSYRLGRTITLNPPDSEEDVGYNFTGWKFYVKSAGSSDFDTDWADAPVIEDAAMPVVFRMPGMALKAVAQWEPAEYVQTIFHYYQNTDLQYFKSIPDGSGSPVTVQYTDPYGSSYSVSGQSYGNGVVSIEISGNTAYFTGAVNNTVYPENLAVIVQNVGMKQDDSFQIQDYLRAFNHYGFAYALRQHGTTIKQYSGTSGLSATVSEKKGMKLEYYYTLERPIEIKADFVVVHTTPNSPNVTVSGDGSFFYGENVELKVVAGGGYTFKGWYRASDIDVASGEDIEIPAVDPISTDTNFSFIARKSEELIALIIPEDPVLPTLAYNGVSELDYNYEASSVNSVSVKVNFPTEGSDTSTVTGYQWYVNGKKIEGATASSFTYPEGWDVGTYELECVVTVKRTDNGMTAEAHSEQPFTLTVNPIDMIVFLHSYSDYYDAKEHSAYARPSSINGPVNSAYTIYYSDHPLTKDNYKTGSTEKLEYVDVAVNESGELITHNVYYYVESHDGNYLDYEPNYQDGDYLSVFIMPVLLELEPGDEQYHRVYNATDAVQGPFDEEGTELYNLVHNRNVYRIVGLAEDDAIDSYIIACQATFNDSHVSAANAVNLYQLQLCNADGTQNHNYYFADEYTVTLPAYIDPMPVELQWGETEFHYDGTPKLPDAQIKTVLPDGDALGVKFAGSKINEGKDYTAVASLIAEGTSQITDFTIQNPSCKFSIVGIEASVKPVAATVIYDGEAHELTEFVFVDQKLNERYSITARATASGIDVGEYTIGVKDIQITDKSNGAVVTGNFVIDSTGTDVLTIVRRPIVFSGIVAEDRVYDGTTDADLNADAVVWMCVAEGQNPELGIVSGDDVALEVSGVFANKDVDRDENGLVTSKPVSIQNAVLSGADAKNYVLVEAECQKETEAKIIPAQVAVKAVDISNVSYGTPAEQVTFAVAYNSFVDGEGKEVLNGTDSTITYSLSTQSGAYDAKTPVGAYTITPDVTGLSARNYVFVPEDGTLTVGKRTLTITTNLVEKTYDGTDTAVITADHYEMEGLAEGEDAQISFTNAHYADPNVGTPNVEAAVAVGNPNYSAPTVIVFPGKINPRKLTVKPKNVNIVYGDSAPEYKASYNFVNGEDVSVMTGAISFACEYDSAVQGKRNADQYDIIPSGYGDEGTVNGNYIIHYENGILTVEKAVLTVSAFLNEKTAETVTYGDNVPMVTYAFSGWKYDGDDTSKIYGIQSGEPSYKAGSFDSIGTEIVSIPSGSYQVTPVTSALVSRNYRFESKAATLTVEKYAVTISGIKALDKIYDGSNSAVIDLTDVLCSGEKNLDKAYFDAHPDEKRFTVTGVFAGKDVVLESGVEAKQDVTLTIVFGKYYSDRIILSESSQKTGTVLLKDAAILQRPLSVKAKDTTVFYGSEIPVYDVVYGTVDGQPVSGLVSGETADRTHVTISGVYSDSPYTQVGLYEQTIIPSAFTGSAAAKADNYTVAYLNGNLEVEQTRLKTPAPVWSSTEPGKATWNEISGIGDVSVGCYTVQLYKNGTAVGSTVTLAGTDERSVDFASEIRKNGAGEYTVGVVAVASKDNNIDNRNVSDSAQGMSGVLYAATLEWSQKVTTVSPTKGTIERDAADVMPVSKVHDASSYVVISGEQIPVAAELINATGYSVSSVVTTDSSVSVTGTQSGANYSGTATIGTLANANTVKMTMNLKLTPATLSAVVTRIPFADEPGTGEDYDSDGFRIVRYGYSDEEAPYFHVDADRTAEDNVTKSGYIYSYQWGAFRQGTSYSFAGGTADQWKFASGQLAGTYSVRCIVTAARSDNGETIAVAETWNPEVSYVTELTIDKAEFYANTVISGWTYGENREAPTLTDLKVGADEHPGIAKTVYEFASKADEPVWSNNVPTDPGEYLVRAFIPSSANYEAFTTAPCDFAIAKAKLNTPENLTNNPSESYQTPYGLIKWDAVDIIQENNGNQPASIVEPEYVVRLYDGAGNLIKTYPATANCEMDIAADIQKKDTYKVEVTAVPVSGNADRYTIGHSRCEDSDPSEKITIAVFGISVSGAEWNGETGSYEKVYDANDVIMTFEGTADSFQWYRNGELISGANQQSLAIKDVLQTGAYSCVAYNEEDGYLVKTQVKITPRTFTLTSADDQKGYDGTVLINHTVTDMDSFACRDGGVREKVVFSFADNVVEVKDTKTGNNTFSIVWNSAETTANPANYSIELAFGTLTITPKDITNDSKIVIEKPNDEVYCDVDYKPEPSVTDIGLETGVSRNLVKGTDFTYSYTHNRNASVAEGTPAEVIITGTGNYTGTRTVTFEIAKRPVTFTGETKTNAVYTGQTISITGVTDNFDAAAKTGVVKGHTFVVSYEAKGINASEIPYAGTISAPEQVKIYADTAKTVDVTANYQIVTVPGALTIQPKAVTVKANNLSKYYGEMDPVLTYTATGLITGQKQEDVLSVKLEREAGEDVKAGGYVITASGDAVQGNYKVTYQPGTFTINPMEIVVTAVDNAKTYGDPDPKLTYKVNKTLAFDEKPEEKLTVKLEREAGEDVKAGGYVITASGDAVQGNYKVTYQPGTFTINPMEIVVTAVDNAKTYGDPDPKLTYKVNKTLAFDEKPDEKLTVTLEREAGEDVKVGGYVITASGAAEQGNYQVTFKPGVFTINPRDISTAVISADAIPDIIYDAKEHRAVPVVKDSIWGSVLIKNQDFICAYLTKPATDPVDVTNVGTKYVTVTGCGNYTGSIEVSYNIIQREVTLTGETKLDAIYTGSKVEITGITPENLVSGHKHNAQYTASGIEIGDYPGKFTNADSVVIWDENDIDVTANYKINLIPGKLHIGKTADTFKVTLEGSTYTYDGKEHWIVNEPVSYAATGETTFLYSFEQDGFATAGKYFTSLSDLKEINAGTYKVYVQATNPNYAQSVVISADLTINRAPVTVTANNLSKTYGELDPVLTYTAEGLQNGEKQENVLTVNLVRESGEDVKAGGYVITASGAAEQGNYQVTFKPDVFTINPRDISTAVISADAIPDIIYDAKEHRAVPVVKDSICGSVLIKDQDFTCAYLTKPATDPVDVTNVGTKYVTVTGCGNYTGSIEVSYNIIQREVTLTGETKLDAIYTGSKVEITGITPENLVSDHKHNAQYTASGIEIGDYPGKFTNADSVVIWDENDIDVTANYKINLIPGKLHIGKTADTFKVTLEGSTYTYDGKEHWIVNEPVSYAATGETTFLYSFEQDGFATAGKYFTSLSDLKEINAGTYKVYVQATNPNYAQSVVISADLIINPAPVTVKANALSKTYGELDPDLTYTAIGLVNNEKQEDVLTVKLVRETGENVREGGYKITASGTAKQGNYLVSFENSSAVFTINPRDINSDDISAADITGLIYNGQKHTPVPVITDNGVVSVPVGDLEAAADFTCEYPDDTNTNATAVDGKNASVFVIGIGNYCGTRTVEFQIERKSIIGADVTFGPELVYNGEEQTREVRSVVIDGLSATYEVADNTATERGEYTMSITGTGNFKDTINPKFKIHWNPDDPEFDGLITVVVERNGVTANMTSSKKKLIRDEVTPEEFIAVEDEGTEIRLVLTITDITSTINDDSRARFLENAPGYKEGMYLDIVLRKEVTPIGGDTTVTEIHNTKNPIGISVDIRTDMINTNKSNRRTYKLERNHNSVIEQLGMSYASGTVNFSSDRFSEYAILYKDSKIPNPSDIPKTGDDSAVMFCVWLMFLSATGLGITAVTELNRKKRYTR